jgi:hypothetical protein
MKVSGAKFQQGFVGRSSIADRGPGSLWGGRSILLRKRESNLDGPKNRWDSVRKTLWDSMGHCRVPLALNALIDFDYYSPPLGTTPMFAPVRRRPSTSTSQNNFKDLSPQQSARVHARPLAPAGTAGTFACTGFVICPRCQQRTSC